LLGYLYAEPTFYLLRQFAVAFERDGGREDKAGDRTRGRYHSENQHGTFVRHRFLLFI
jgi:hypothetical protein